MTSIEKQYREAKKVAPDAILLFRMGDFYECYSEDARVCAKVLGLTLTTRNKRDENPFPMAGFPCHQVDTYMQKLIKLGYRVAVNEGK